MDLSRPPRRFRLTPRCRPEDTAPLETQSCLDLDIDTPRASTPHATVGLQADTNQQDKCSRCRSDHPRCATLAQALLVLVCFWTGTTCWPQQSSIESSPYAATATTRTEIQHSITNLSSSKYHQYAHDDLVRAGPDAVEPLTEALTEATPVKRSRIINILGEIRSLEAIPKLTQILLNDSNSTVRQDAITALCAIGGSTADALVVDALSSDRDSDVRAHAASSRCMKRAPTATAGLIKALTSDRIGKVREQAAKTLGTIGDATAIDPLILTLKTDRDSSVREAAAAVLGAFQETRIVNELIELLARDENPSVQKAIVQTLGDLGHPSALPQLLILLGNGIAKDEVKAALDKIPFSPIPALRELLQDDSSSQTLAAVSAMGDLSDVDVIPLLEQALQHPNLSVQLAALKEVAARNDSIAIALLANTLRSHPSPAVRKESITLIRQKHLGSAIDPAQLMLSPLTRALQYAATEDLNLDVQDLAWSTLLMNIPDS